MSKNKYADNIERLLDNYDEELSRLSTKFNNLSSSIDSIRKERFNDRCKTINLIPECSDKEFILTEFLRRCEEKLEAQKTTDNSRVGLGYLELRQIAKEMREG